MKRRGLLQRSAAGLAVLGARGHLATPRASAAPTKRGDVIWNNGSELLKLAVHRLRADGACVLYVHGATFPTAMSVAWRIDGVSWLDQLQQADIDAWSFDFTGYGDSDRPVCFAQPASAHPAFGRCASAAAQVIAVLRHIRAQRPAVPIHLIAHSWGCLPAQQAAIDRPDLIARLILFGPPVVRDGSALNEAASAWTLVTAADQRPRHRSGLPVNAATPVRNAEVERWCAAYLRTDRSSGERAPSSVKVPSGPMQDIADLFAGNAIVASERITQPTLIVRGEWDHVTTDADARRLFDTLQHAADRRDIKIAKANHWMHLQPARTALWAETLSFLRE